MKDVNKMGFIMAFLLELILEGGYEYAKSDKAPKIFRNFVVFIMTSIMVVLLWTAFMIREEGMLLLLPLTLAIIIGVFLYQLLKELRRRMSLGRERD